MARIVTPPATVTEPAAHILDAPNSRPDYPLVRPAPLSGGGLGPVAVALQRLCGLRIDVTALRVEVGAGSRSCSPADRELAHLLHGEMLLAEHRAGLGPVALYVGPRQGGEAAVERLIGQEVARALFAERRYDLLPTAGIALVHARADMLVDGLLDLSLRGAPVRQLMDFLPQAA